MWRRNRLDLAPGSAVFSSTGRRDGVSRTEEAALLPVLPVQVLQDAVCTGETSEAAEEEEKHV